MKIKQVQTLNNCVSFAGNALRDNISLVIIIDLSKNMMYIENDAHTLHFLVLVMAVDLSGSR